VTSHYVIDQSVISICDMKKMLVGEAMVSSSGFYMYIDFNVN